MYVCLYANKSTGSGTEEDMSASEMYTNVPFLESVPAYLMGHQWPQTLQLNSGTHIIIWSGSWGEGGLH